MSDHKAEGGVSTLVEGGSLVAEGIPGAFLLPLIVPLYPLWSQAAPIIIQAELPL